MILSLLFVLIGIIIYLQEELLVVILNFGLFLISDLLITLYTSKTLLGESLENTSLILIILLISPLKT